VYEVEEQKGTGDERELPSEQTQQKTRLTVVVHSPAILNGGKIRGKIREKDVESYLASHQRKLDPAAVPET
jgi:hypothetical protein